MHEMAMMQGVLDLTLRYAAEGKARKVTAIQIQMGEFCDVVPQIFKDYFAIAAHGTIADGAEIRIERRAGCVYCRCCGWQGEVKLPHIECGDCGSTDLQMLSGRQFVVESLEAE